MDYLVYVEHNAENLQFYLWFHDYVLRWEALSDAEKALSPEWFPVADTPIDPKRFTVSALMDNNYEGTTGAELFGADKDTIRRASAVKDTASVIGSTVGSAISEATTLTTAEVTAQAGLKWQPCMLNYTDQAFFLSLTQSSYYSTLP